jgi:hypothetical protein
MSLTWYSSKKDVFEFLQDMGSDFGEIPLREEQCPRGATLFNIASLSDGESQLKGYFKEDLGIKNVRLCAALAGAVMRGECV